MNQLNGSQLSPLIDNVRASATDLSGLSGADLGDVLRFVAEESQATQAVFAFVSGRLSAGRVSRSSI